MKKRFEELDALRGIAALMVVFFHFTMGRAEYNQIFKLGTTGVDLFFIISGFVIFMSLQHVNRGIDFVISRVSRLYPTYWSSVTFTFIFILCYYIYLDEGNFGKKLIFYLANLTMFQFYLKIPDLDGPYWTMIIEMLFYISILILYRFKLLNYLNYIGIFICLGTVTIARLWGTNRFIIWIPLLQFLPLFFAGTIFYEIYNNKNFNKILNYSIIAFCLLCQLLLFPYAGRSRFFINQFEYNLMLIIYFTLFILFVNDKLKFIVNNFALFLGKISYSLYLTHQFISLKLIIPILYGKFGINFWVVTVLIDLPIVIGIASFITYKIEMRYSKKMKEKLQTTLGLAQAKLDTIF